MQGSISKRFAGSVSPEARDVPLGSSIGHGCLSLWIRLRKLRTKTGSFRVASVQAWVLLLESGSREGAVALAFVASKECDEELSKGLEAKNDGSCW